MKNLKQSNNRYNVAIPKLFDIILNLNEKQQFTLLRQAEELLTKEKRASIRKSCYIPVTFATSNRVHSSNITNISQSGGFLNTRAATFIGEELLMTFKMEGFDKPLKIKGEVMHATRWGIGVEFRNISKYVMEMIGTLIERMD